MAEVDFTNAVLDITGGVKKALESANLGLTATRSPLYLPLLQNSSKVRISNYETMNILTNTPTHLAIVFTGSFQESGTEFWFGDRSNSNQQLNWHVSNISFSSGDTYDFRVDIETSGNS